MTGSERQVFLPRSKLAGNLWPAVPDAGRALAMALQYQLQQSQHFPREVIAELQKTQLKEVLDHAVRTVPHYRSCLDYRDPARAIDEPDFWSAAWPQIPILSRSDVQQAGAGLASESLPADHGPTSTISTSGSTGRPIELTGTGLTELMWRAFLMRDHLWHQRVFTLPLAAIRATRDVPAEPPDGFTGTGWDPLYRAGKLHALTIQSSLEQQIAWLRKVRPGYLVSFPSNLLELARRSMDERIRFDSLRQVLAVGEVVTPECRRAVADAWGVRLVDAYTAQETGYLALQCPAREDCYHVQSENVILEVVDDAGQPCREGQVGRVVVTTLHNFATPLIRYDIGDYARSGGVCGCGRTLPVLTRILGRRRNMVTLPDGGKRWPYLGENRYRTVAPVRQYQLVQKSLALVQVRLVVERALTRSEEAALSVIIREELGHPFELAFSYPDAIARSAGGKFEDFRSEVRQDQ